MRSPATMPKLLTTLTSAICLCVATACLFTTACRGPSKISDTGYTGLWERRIGNNRSIVTIREKDGEYLFCWSREKEDNPDRIRCAGDGVSEYFVGRDLIYEYRYTTFRKEGSDDLFLRVEGIPKQEGTTPINWVDQLVLQPGGLELWTFQLELNGEVAEVPRGPIKLVKIADDPR